jgi:putative flippase GtrA
MREFILQICRFGIVGLVSTIVHYTVALWLEQLSIHLLCGNIIAFFVAFQISYLGHSLWSFELRKGEKWRAMKRFLLISVGGFLLNESLLLLFTKHTSLTSQVTLGIVLCIVAGLTYLGSKIWAFAPFEGN